VSPWGTIESLSLKFKSPLKIKDLLIKINFLIKNNKQEDASHEN